MEQLDWGPLGPLFSLIGDRGDIGTDEMEQAQSKLVRIVPAR
jgi:hypothetical protein